MTWRPARSITTLRQQINTMHPTRPTESDGIVGDLRHQHETQSDHNPNARRVVTAWDITAAPFCDALAERLRQLGKSGDRRVKYVIWKRRIASAQDGWAWRPYHGADPHTNHIHLSVSADPKQYDRSDVWPITTLNPDNIKAAPQEDDMTPAQEKKLDRVIDLLEALAAPRVPGQDSDPKHLSLGDIMNKVEKEAQK